MSKGQKWVIGGGAVALLLVLLFPQWRQISKADPEAEPLMLGHHFLWTPPQPESRETLTDFYPPSDFRVVRDGDAIVAQCESLLGITTILLLVLRRRPSDESGNTTIAASLTRRGIALVSLSLALCLPVPPPDGVPLVILCGMAMISPNNGYMYPMSLPILAVASLAFYFINVFLLMNAMLWLSRGPIRK